MLEQDKDWTELPPELLQIIAKKLPDLLDFIRFRVTCKTWCSSAPLSELPPQFPCLIELLEGRNYHSDGTQSKKLRFYYVSSCQTLTIRLTLDQSQRLWNPIQRGVFSHYLTFVDSHEEILSFINPLTKDQFSLPWPRVSSYFTYMVWTGTDPIRNRSIVLVDPDLLLMREQCGWACYDPHSNKWVQKEGYYHNSCYCQGMLFFTIVACVTWVSDASSKKVLYKIPPPEDEVRKYDWCDLNYMDQKSYLVESLGIILRVSLFYDIWDMEKSIFHIYRLDFHGLDGQPSWVRVDNIGNQILFLEDMTGFSMTARPSTGFREGCIYFIIILNDGEFIYKLYVHDILAGTVERVPCPFKMCTWFLPSLC